MSKAIERVADEYLKEKKRIRRWKIFFRLSWLFIGISFLFLYFVFFNTWNNNVNQPHVALIKVDGIIANDANTNAERVNESSSIKYQDVLRKPVGFFAAISSPRSEKVVRPYMH